MTELHLLETSHPSKQAGATFDALVGIDDHKRQLLDELTARLDSKRLDAWLGRHHPNGLGLTLHAARSTPLVLLSGEVGCGKTALAHAVGTSLAKALDRKLVVMETPSDLRGWGHVGELSARVTDAFARARRRARDVGAALLIVDEADDIATKRSQIQAHHEDRAGLNVLIKQLDELARSKDPLVVILITNRDGVLDPAVRRRAGLHLKFARPNAGARAEIFAQLLTGVAGATAAIPALVAASEREGTAFSSSDLVDRLARSALRIAQREDVPVSVPLVLRALRDLEPSPLIGDGP